VSPHSRQGTAHGFGGTGVLASASVPIAPVTSYMLTLPLQTPRLQGMACAEQNTGFLRPFFPKKGHCFKHRASGLFYIRTNRTERVKTLSTCPYGIGFNDDGKAVPLWCHKWSCERCRVVLARQWAWRASIHIGNSPAPAYFWTLTLRSQIRTSYAGFRALPANWDALRKIVQRKTGKWSYLAFVECHPKRDAIPHFHVLSMVAAPVVGSHKSSPIKDLAFRAGFGFIASETIVTSYKAAWYVAKYASKHDPAIPRGFRRCRCSRDWAKLPEVDLLPYMVKSRIEHVWEFALRVADVVGEDPDDILFKYKVACNLHDVAYTDEYD